MPYWSKKEEKYIIPASEVATFVLCEEAWKLIYLNKKHNYNPSINKKKSQSGIDSHQQWRDDLEEILYFSKNILITLIFVVLAIYIYITK